MKFEFIERATWTDRKCAQCQQPALRFGYTATAKSKHTQKNPSSRTPLCLTHAVTS